MGDTSVVVASNRGPLSYVADESGRLSTRRGGGGMISALEAHEEPVTWVCAALTDGDRAAVRATPDGLLR
jgi:trehalose 6-phosphate synthase